MPKAPPKRPARAADVPRPWSAAVALLAVFVQAGAPWTLASDAVDSFQRPPASGGTDGDLNDRLFSLYGSGRVDLWRVALSTAESEPLLAAVFDHAERRDFVYEHVWRVGDLLLWDNRCSSHARTDFPSSERRLMLRTTVKGTVRPY